MSRFSIRNRPGLPGLFFVGFLGVVGFFGDEFELFGAVFFYGAVETAIVADVAPAGVDDYLQNQAILIAIDKYLLDLLEMAALFALCPELFAGAAVVSGQTGFDG